MEILTPCGPKFFIAVIGTGPFLLEVLSRATPDEPLTLSPTAQVSVLADPKASPELRERLAGHGVLVLPDLASALEAVPLVNLVIDLTGELLGGEGRASIPGGIGVFGGFEAETLLKLIAADPDCRKCRQDLLRTKLLLHTIINQMQDDILLLDSAGRIIDLNDVNLERLGTTRKDITGKHCWETLEGYGKFRDSREDFEDFKRTLLTSNQSDFVDTRVDDQGRLQYHRIYAYPVFIDGADRVSHIVIMRRDITQRTNMENRLQQSEKLAAIGELSTYIAHEIRNPLFAIAGFANSLLRSKNLDDSAREKAQVIIEESNRLDKILKSIVDFARPTHSVGGELDVNRVVRETMDVMAMGFDQKGIEVRLDLAGRPPKGKGEDEMLKQCLINLVKNAVEAMDGGGELAVSTGFDGKFITLNVADSGAGIAPEHLDQVFNPFFSTKGKGSGLGLAMTKKILDGFGGAVDLTSTVGKGTSVTLFIPPSLAVNE
jgi:two-component system, sporulation sensor kinase E